MFVFLSFHRNPTELYTNYDSSQIAFNPPIPTPKNVDAKAKPGIYIYSDNQFERYCTNYLKSDIAPSPTQRGMFDFYQNCK
jgi:hypothetical protein